MCERIDGKGLEQYKDYEELEQYKEAEHHYQLSIQLQNEGKPAESTEHFIKALEIQAKLASITEPSIHQSGEYQLQSEAISMLPSDIWLMIFQYLSLKELVQLALVCKYFKAISEDNFLWKNLYFTAYPIQKLAYLKKLAKNGTDEEEGENQFFNWKIYYKNYQIAYSKFSIAFLYISKSHCYYQVQREPLAIKPTNCRDSEYNYLISRNPYKRRTVGCFPAVIGQVRGHYWSAGSGFKEYLVGKQVDGHRLYHAWKKYQVVLDYPLVSEYFLIPALRTVVAFVFNCCHSRYLSIKWFPFIFPVPLAAHHQIRDICTVFVNDFFVNYLLLESSSLIAMYATEYLSSIVLNFENDLTISLVPVHQLTIVKNESKLFHALEKNQFNVPELASLIISLKKKCSHCMFENVLIIGKPTHELSEFIEEIKTALAHYLPVVCPANAESMVSQGLEIFSELPNIRDLFYSRLEMLAEDNFPFQEIYYTNDFPTDSIYPKIDKHSIIPPYWELDA